MKTIFRHDIQSYSTLFILGIAAGLTVIFFCEIPDNDLWFFYYWSSDTYGFWALSTALIVLFSEKRKDAAIHASVYIFIMFFMTTIYKSFHMYRNRLTPFHDLSELALNHISGWLLYSVPPAVLCGFLGAVLWNGRKNTTLGNLLCILPAVFIFAETLLLFYSVFTKHTKLFSAMTDCICFILYAIIIYRAKSPKQAAVKFRE